ncbi:MAG: DUF2723 domain-containing protein [Armatimonadota bacterium]
MERGLSAVRARVVPKVVAVPAVAVTIAVFAVAFPILAFFSAPGISFHDSGEFALAVASNGLPHSPGAPTWAILNQLFHLLTFNVEAARSANLFSAFCGAATVAFSSAFVFRHFSDRTRNVQWLAAIVTGLSILGTGAFLEQSFIAEQYTLMTALMSALLLVIQTNDSNPKTSWFYLMGLIWGLAVGNHPSQVILGFLMLLPVLQSRKAVSVFRSVPMGILGIITGLLVFVWLPLRAAAHPTLAWGHPDNLTRFLWNVGREQWPTRAMSTAPIGFTKAWFNSYNLFGEMGFISTVLAVFGTVLGLRRAIKPLSWIAFLVIPYTLLMLACHLRQSGMDLIYLRFYGVRDWHIPVYMGLSICGGMGAVWLIDLRHKCTEKVRIGTLSTAALALAGFVPFQLSKENMRNYGVARDFAHAYLDTVPKDAIISTFCDDSTHVLAYEHYANKMAPSVYFTFGMPLNVLIMQPKDGWTLELKRAFLTDFIFRASLNPLCLPRILTEDEIKNRPLFTEYTSSEEADITPYCLPNGYLIQVLERKTSDAEVLAADNQFKVMHPELFVKPTTPQHRLSREGFSYGHLRRGLFFMKRKMWQQVKDELEIALAWEPENPQILFPYGAALEELKDYRGAEKAYLTCIDVMPDYPTARQNLALLYLYAGRDDLAMKYAQEELVLTRGAKNTKDLIALLEKKSKTRSR